MRNKPQLKKINYLLLLFSFITIVIMCNSCACRFPDYPPGSTCTFNIPEPKKYECYTNNANTGRKIKLIINIRVTFFRGSAGRCSGQETEFSTNTIAVEPILGPATIFPIQLTAMIPNNGTTYAVETTIIGDECSTCANGYGPPSEALQSCPPLTITSTNPTSYRAAKPQWNINVPYQSFSQVINLAPAFRIPNYPNTCGCTVN